MKKKVYSMIFLLVVGIVIPLQVSAETKGDTVPNQKPTVTENDTNSNKTSEDNQKGSSEEESATTDDKVIEPEKTEQESASTEDQSTPDQKMELPEETKKKDSKKSIITMQSVSMKNYQKSTISKVGRILSAEAKIYESLGGKTIVAGAKYTDTTLYIKQQAKSNKDTYYLISTRSSATNGAIGWVNADEMRIQSHKTVDSKAKTLYLDGTGWAYRTPWGASKDILINNLSPYTYSKFEVILTEKVGDYVWYKGFLNGQTVWIQGFNVDSAKTDNISKVGRIQDEGATIYQTFGNSSSGFQAGKKHTDKLYYINRQLKVFDELFYQVSQKPSSGNVGWIKAKDIRVQKHKVISRQSKTLYLDGTGWAYTAPWGGAKDVVNKDLSPYKYLKFNVSRTERIGDYIWYQGDVDGKSVWIQGYNFLGKPNYTEQNTDKVGRISSPNVLIYKELSAGSSVFKAGSDHTDTIFYIKKQAKVSDQLYYLISSKRSSNKGVIGWVKSDNIKVQSHNVIDTRKKTLYLDGTGWAYTDPWGGSGDVVNRNLTPFKYLKFHINRTERIGKFVWYRGTLDGKSVWIQGYNFHTKVNAKKTSTSKVGRISSENVYIYNDILNSASVFKAGNKYTDKLLYIKKQSEINGQRYFMISTKRSSTNGVIGWVKSGDIKEQSHKVVNTKNLNYYLDGTGWSYLTPWGGAKDVVSKKLPKGELFKVNRTEKVGNYFWYRGTLNGKTVWIQAFNVITPEFSPTSRVGRIGNSKAIIYQTIGDESTDFKAGSKYTDKLFYIKRKTEIFGQLYYGISNHSYSSVVGWINSNDIRSQKHVHIDSKEKAYYLDGTGWAYTDPWGGSKDVVYNDLSKYEDALFEINMTEKVGDYFWYRGILDGKQVWIQSYNVVASLVDKTEYDLTLEKMAEIQTSLRYPGPQSDQGNYAWVSGAYIKNGVVKLDGGFLNIRTGPGTDYTDIGNLYDGDSVEIVDRLDGWVAVKVSKDLGWLFATPENVRYYLNPNNFTDTLRGKLQFLNLSSSANINANEVNTKILRGKGILEDHGQTFITAGRTHGINEIYLISHALLETGNGDSTLATGVPVDKNGNITINSKGNIDKTSKTVAVVYNMYGVGAVDGDALAGGAKYAFDHGWTTPAKAIIGGAVFVSNDYVSVGQDTLYEMRWNPFGADKYGYATHQYATDIAWAYKQTYRMNKLYNLLSSYNLVFDIPVYR